MPIDLAASNEPTNPTKTRALSFLSEIKEREKEFTDGWWKNAKDADDIFSMDTKNTYEEETPYNILYSNTEVLLPSLYSATPKPDIRSRFKGEDVKPIPEMLERFLTIASDPGSPGGDCFDNAMSDAVLSALVPGMGYVRLMYSEDKAFPITFVSGHYRSLIWGKASRWSKVPWIAFKHSMKKEQMFSQFDIKEEAQAEFIPSDNDEESKDSCCVYELWHKATRKVYFLSEEWQSRELKESDDPLNLENFYPTPGLIVLTQRPGRLKPISLFAYYRNQANELNKVSVRLNKVLSAIKVRGFYNGLLGDDLKGLLSGDETDNGLIPAASAGLLSQSGGLDKQIWLMPLEKLVQVAQQLYTAREAIKQVIYELTGISDIIRGSSVASETATAQDLKNKWGTVRLRRMQTMVANYARDLFRMSVDCGSSKIPAEQWQEIIQMPTIPTAQEQAVAKQQVTYEQTVNPGQSPKPELLAKTQAPTLESLLERIANDINRTFIVNIQTSSTIDLDTAQDKADISEFMNAMGQLLPGLQQLAALGPTGLEAAKSILSAVCMRYKFGIDIADVINKIEPPAPQEPEQKGPPPPTPEEQQVVAEKAKLELAKIASEMEILAARKAYELEKIEVDKQKLAIEIQRSNLQLTAQRTKMAAGVQNAPV